MSARRLKRQFDDAEPPAHEDRISVSRDVAELADEVVPVQDRSRRVALRCPLHRNDLIDSSGALRQVVEELFTSAEWTRVDCTMVLIRLSSAPLDPLVRS
jgi:hypothetical protein